VGIVDPAERIREVGRLIRAWREEPSLRFSDTLAAGLNRLPPAAVTSVFGSMLKHVDFVATNVPGPPSPVYMAGAKLLRQYAFAPLTGAPINVALVSYGSLGCVGINADAGAIGDIAALGTAMRDGFAEVAGHPLQERRTS
jgi:diacylglycerol O-acyltransferase / wax synthase